MKKIITIATQQQFYFVKYNVNISENKRDVTDQEPNVRNFQLGKRLS